MTAPTHFARLVRIPFAANDVRALLLDGQLFTPEVGWLPVSSAQAAFLALIPSTMGDRCSAPAFLTCTDPAHQAERSCVATSVRTETTSQSEPPVRTLETRILAVLRPGPLSTSGIASALGRSPVSGHIRKNIQSLVARGAVEFTLPEKRGSRFQRYRLVRPDVAAAPALGEDVSGDSLSSHRRAQPDAHPTVDPEGSRTDASLELAVLEPSLQSSSSFHISHPRNQ